MHDTSPVGWAERALDALINIYDWLECRIGQRVATFCVVVLALGVIGTVTIGLLCLLVTGLLWLYAVSPLAASIVLGVTLFLVLCLAVTFFLLAEEE